eukprot:COSAG02_NODE_5486_length_4288_cov_1.915493_2_plen_365_part_00
MEPEPELALASPVAGMEPLFGAFDRYDGGLRRAIPPAMLDGFPLRAVDTDDEDSSAGRSLATACDVAAGDVLLIAEPWASVVMSEQRKHYCAGCHGNLPALHKRVGKKGRAKNRATVQHCAREQDTAMPCDCGVHQYCSQRCEDAPGAAWHRQWTCAGVKSISEDRRCSQHAKTIARLVLDTIVRGACPSKGSEGGAGSSWHDGVLLLQSHVAHHSDGQAEDDVVVAKLVEAALLAQRLASPSLPPSLATCSREMLTALISCVQCNDFGTHGGDRMQSGTKQVALGLYPAAAFFNHSCRPNVARTFDDQGNLVLTAMKFVAEGQALNIMYGCLQDVCWEERQLILREGHFFECHCERCIEEESR